jgi:hypothetical protein
VADRPEWQRFGYRIERDLRDRDADLISDLGLVVLRRLCGSLTRFSPMRNWLLMHELAAARGIEAASVARSREISLAFGVSFRFGEGFGPPLTGPLR